MVLDVGCRWSIDVANVAVEVAHVAVFDLRCAPIGIGQLSEEGVPLVVLAPQVRLQLRGAGCGYVACFAE